MWAMAFVGSTLRRGVAEAGLVGSGAMRCGWSWTTTAMAMLALAVSVATLIMFVVVVGGVKGVGWLGWLGGRMVRRRSYTRCLRRSRRR